MSTDGVDPINLIRNVPRDLSDPQPVDVIGRVDGRYDRSDTLPDENSILLPEEPLVSPEVPDRRESGPSGVWDEVVVSLDDLGGEQSGDDGGDVLNGDFRSQVDPSIVQRLLDGPEESGGGIVQA